MRPVGETLRALIVDDDAAARGHLRSLLTSVHAVDVIGECGDGRSAVPVIRATAPDVVFLDVQMPDLDGFGVVAEIGASAMPPVIFTSAYAQFAIRAFEAYALDYVLKPIEAARLAHAVERLGQLRPRSDSTAQLAGLLSDHAARRNHPTALAVRAGAQYQVVRIEEIDWISADGNHVLLHLPQRKTRVVTRSLATLEADVLDPARFLRVHKSVIVNIDRVMAIEPSAAGDATLLLSDGTRVPCSRRYRPRIEALLYFTS
jgi:two-component system, LytTR family, response regulator